MFEVLWKCEFACSVKKSKEESGAVNCGRDAAVSMIIICCCNSKMNMKAISPLLVKTTETMANDCQVMNNHDSEIVKAQISANRFIAQKVSKRNVPQKYKYSTRRHIQIDITRIDYSQQLHLTF